MMTTFDRREEAFENMFAHDEEMQFRAESRRAKMMAAWAGGLMGKTGAALETYADAIVASTIATGGAEALHRRIGDDLAAAGVPISSQQIHERSDTFMAEAIHYVKTV